MTIKITCSQKSIAPHLHLNETENGTDIPLKCFCLNNFEKFTSANYVADY